MSADLANSQLYALTLWPEWAEAICYLGKRVENRDWRPPKNVLRLAIHAGAHVGGRPGRVATAEGLAAVARMYTLANPGASYPWSSQAVRPAIITGCIVALAKVESCDREERTGWDVPDAWHWRLSEVLVLPQPIPARGAQGLWALSGAQVACIARQLPDATLARVPHVR